MFELTQSKLGMFSRCPEQFRRRYMLGEIRPPGIAARRGSAFHHAAKLNHEEKIITREDQPLEEMQESARDHYIELINTRGVFIPKEEAPDKSEQQRLIGAGLDQAVNATEVYHDEIAPAIQPKLVEEKMIDEQNFTVALSGIPDVIDINGAIIDLKLQARKNQTWADAQLQPTFYSALYRARFDELPERFIYEQVTTAKRMERDQVITMRNDRHIQLLERRIEAFLAAAERGSFPPCEPGHWLCSPKWCGYYKSCKYV